MQDISHLIEALCSSLYLENSLSRLFSIINRQINADGVFINFFDQHKESVIFLGHVNLSGIQTLPEPINIPKGFLGKLKKEEGSVICIRQIDDDPFTQFVLSKTIPEAKSFLMLDLFKDKKHLGVVCFYSCFKDNFSETQSELVQRLHDPLALVTCNALNNFLLNENSLLGKRNSELIESLANEKRKPIVNFLKFSPSMTKIAEQIENIAPTDATVLILGETGTGKEVIADLVHTMSSRSEAPIIKLNCGAIPENLIDSELFGYEKGAFTDAKQTRKGYFEQAEGGTLLLDEIGELSQLAQVRLLRAIQQKTIIRVGGTKEIPINVRIIAATHRNLKHMVEEGKFREDLWFRLNLYPINLPPLRERGVDAEFLANLFLNKLKDKYGLPNRPMLSQESVDFLYKYSWPGNVRELENVLERAVLSGQRNSIELQNVLSELTSNSKTNSTIPILMLTSYAEACKQYFTNLLKTTHGKISGTGGAAEIAQMHPNTLRSKLKKLNIEL